MAANFVIEPNKKGKAAVWKHWLHKRKRRLCYRQFKGGLQIMHDNAEIQREYDKPDGPHAS